MEQQLFVLSSSRIFSIAFYSWTKVRIIYKCGRFYKYFFWAETAFIHISFSSIRMHPSLASSDKARASEGRATLSICATSCWLSISHACVDSSVYAISDFVGQRHLAFWREIGFCPIPVAESCASQRVLMLEFQENVLVYNEYLTFLFSFDIYREAVFEAKTKSRGKQLRGFQRFDGELLPLRTDHLGTHTAVAQYE